MTFHSSHRAISALAFVICAAWPATSHAERQTPEEYLLALTDMVAEEAPHSAEAASRIRDVYQPYVDVLALDDLNHLQNSLADGGLVPVPDPERFNLRLRLTGPNPIGEKDVAHQRSYVSARAAAIGCLLDVASRVKSGPIEITSLARHLEYQNQLRQTNGNAVTDVPTHALGLAFDIAMVNTPLKTVMETRDVLRQMSDAGDLFVIVERQQLVFHVAPQPSRLGYYAALYSDAVTGHPWRRNKLLDFHTASVTTAVGAIRPTPDVAAEWWAADNVPIDLLASPPAAGDELQPRVAASGLWARYIAAAEEIVSAAWLPKWAWTLPSLTGS